MSGGSKITLLHLFHWRGRFKPRTVVNLAVFTLLMCGWRRDLQQQTLKEYLSVVSISWQMLLLLFSDTVLLWWLDRDRICHFVWFWSYLGDSGVLCHSQHDWVQCWFQGLFVPFVDVTRQTAAGLWFCWAAQNLCSWARRVKECSCCASRPLSA